MTRLLLVEDEQLLRWAIRGRLVSAGHVVSEAATLAEAEEHLRRQRPEVVLLDIHLPDGNGLDFLANQQEKLAESIVMVFTGEGRIEDAVRAMKLGAWDFLSKPVDTEELLRMVSQAGALRNQGLEAESFRRARERQSRVKVIAESKLMKEVLRLAATVANTSTTVLIQGETGAGKEVIARYIHAQSARSAAPLQALNCAALPQHLVESELFGHEKGAFTDAKFSHKGLFELADGGTVVLDEISEFPQALQAKLLRFLEDHTLRRVGGAREIQVDVRVIALTNRPLLEEVQSHRFREDLYYRLNVFPITVPPLRERSEDIVPLAEDFVRRFAADCGKRFVELAPDLKQRLIAHRWTGNVRELRNLIERAMIMEEGPVLTGHQLPLSAAGATVAEPGAADEQEPIIPLDDLEMLMVKRALRAAGGNQSQAARLLEVSRDQLRYRVKRYRDLGVKLTD